MTAPHCHELDGTLHDGCPMCDDIRSRMAGEARDRSARTALEAHRARAERSRLGRDRLAAEQEDGT